MGYKESSNTTGYEYFYDANGNMIKDLNKGITNIEYNFINLPERVDIADNISRYLVEGSSGRYEYNLTDHLGNVRMVLDETGNVV